MKPTELKRLQKAVETRGSWECGLRSTDIAAAINELERLRAELEQAKQELRATQEDLQTVKDDSWKSAEGLREELVAARSESEQVKRERDAAKATVATLQRETDRMLDSAYVDIAALEAKLKTAADAHPGCGLLDDLAGECRCAQREQHLRADNARLREALKRAAHSIHERCIDASGATSGHAPGDNRCNTSCHAVHEDLAATDSREWLRDFGMRVAEETREGVVERFGKALTREEWDAVLAAVVAGVMK